MYAAQAFDVCTHSVNGSQKQDKEHNHHLIPLTFGSENSSNLLCEKF